MARKNPATSTPETTSAAPETVVPPAPVQEVEATPENVRTETVDLGTSTDVAEVVGRVRAALGRGTIGMVEAGRILLEEENKGKRFKAVWQAIGWTHSTAHRLANVAEHFGGVTDATLANFDLSALYVLSSGKASPKNRADAIKDAEAGRPVTNKAAKVLCGIVSGGGGARNSNKAAPPISEEAVRREASKLGIAFSLAIALLTNLDVRLQETPTQTQAA